MKERLPGLGRTRLYRGQEAVHEELPAQDPGLTPLPIEAFHAPERRRQERKSRRAKNMRPKPPVGIQGHKTDEAASGGQKTRAHGQSGGRGFDPATMRCRHCGGEVRSWAVGAGGGQDAKCFGCPRKWQLRRGQGDWQEER